jgi:putative ABC transport system permease protein
MRQAIFIALGLALGIGLVMVVKGASNGVQAAQAKVLRSLYGVGTDVTVTTAPKAPSGSSSGGTRISIGPGGSQICSNGKCESGKAAKIDTLASDGYGPLSSSTVTSVGKLHGVSAAAGNLLLTDNQITIPANPSTSGIQPPNSFTVDGTDISHPALGPLSNARLTSGGTFKAADDNADVALVDSGYATANKLKTGSTITIAKVSFKVIGIISQPQGSSPPDVYIPLARAQALAIDPATSKSLKGDVNTIYVTAASASEIPAVQQEIEKLLPKATVTSSSSLASEVTGTLGTAAKLANDLGRWLSVLVLIAAFAVASLLTIAAVSRRVQEFGTLKALGWPGRRIIGQVLGESVSTGILGGLAGVGLGFAGVAIIDKVAPKLSAIVPSSGGGGPQGGLQTAGGGAGPISRSINPAAVSHTVTVPWSASLTAGAIALAVLLAIAGGLFAGSFGGWRAARLRPAAALTRVA